MTEETTNNDIDLLNEYIEKTKQFNIFKVLGMKEGSENRHSNFIAWLLDSKESHKFGKKFFNEFFNGLGIRDFCNDKNYMVSREESSETGRPDILIKDEEENVVCVIEVKFGAGETKNQFKNYYEDYSKHKCEKFILLDIDNKNYYKSCDKYKDEKFNFSNKYIFATFEKNILPILNELTLKDISDNGIVINILKQYINLLEEVYYIMPPNVIESCKNYLLNNNSLIDALYKTEGSSIVENLLHKFIWYSVPKKYNNIILMLTNHYSLERKKDYEGAWITKEHVLQQLGCKDENNTDFIFHNYPEGRGLSLTINNKEIPLLKGMEYIENVNKDEYEIFEQLKEKINDALKVK